MMASVKHLVRPVNLNNGKTIPAIGLGVYRSPPGETTKDSVLAALRHGYRHIDTAEVYGNEADVGEAVRESGIPREEIFITTKVPTFRATQDGFKFAVDEVDKSLKRLGCGYLDMVLLHSPHHPEQRLKKWAGLEQCVKDGKIKTIGVSNYGIHHLKELLAAAQIKPAVNQLEINPFITRTELCKFCTDNGIVLQAYSPLAKAKRLDNVVLVNLASAHKKTPAQIMLKWGIQKDFIILPKSNKEERIKENADMDDWELSEKDMLELDGLDEYFVTGWDPTKDP
eukprot:m.94240 g.94240  ORF g.94240 m.94240 type:complete len:283 (-) comp13434_c0_seq1:34-882(-)